MPMNLFLQDVLDVYICGNPFHSIKLIAISHTTASIGLTLDLMFYLCITLNYNIG